MRTKEDIKKKMIKLLVEIPVLGEKGKNLGQETKEFKEIAVEIIQKSREYETLKWVLGNE